jgi:predicted NAD/FAD-dependent oxidoreductase
MKHREIVKSIQFIIPDAEFILAGDELTWLDQNNTKPTKKEIESGWIAYQAAEESAEQARLTAKATAQAKLAALGLTVEDLQALGL